MSKMVWVLVRRGSTCLGHGEGNATTYELATDSIWGGNIRPAFSSLDAASEYLKENNGANAGGFFLLQMEVLGDGGL